MAQTVSDTRRAFLDFFKTREHAEVASGPIVPPNDPTLMFANAGMVQFKDVFTGRDERPYVRATSSQKCIRIAGKHNDFEAVGPSPRHHTFFEMLGNFSFGDYFKEEAIVYAWEFLTKTLDIPAQRLAVSYFGGEDGVPADLVARDLWKKVSGLSDDRIVGMGAADNFWQMGDTGPCGPCSELHYFVGDNVDVSTFGQEQLADGTGWMEIWNLVFMRRGGQAQRSPETLHRHRCGTRAPRGGPSGQAHELRHGPSASARRTVRADIRQVVRRHDGRRRCQHARHRRPRAYHSLPHG